VGAELFHADGRTDGQTDMTKERVSFRKFAKAPKSVLPVCYNSAEVISIDMFSVRNCVTVLWTTCAPNFSVFSTLWLVYSDITNMGS